MIFFGFFDDLLVRFSSANCSSSSCDLVPVSPALFHRPNRISVGVNCVDLFTLWLWFLDSTSLLSAGVHFGEFRKKGCLCNIYIIISKQTNYIIVMYVRIVSMYDRLIRP